MLFSICVVLVFKLLAPSWKCWVMMPMVPRQLSTLQFNTGSSRVQHLHYPPVWWGRLYPQQVSRRCKTETSGWYTRGSCCHPEGPQQAAETGWLEPHSVQQGEMQTPIPGVEKTHGPICAGPRPAGKHLCGKRLGILVDIKLKKSQAVSKKADGILGCIWQSIAADQGRWSFPCIQHWWSHTWSTVSSSGLLGTSEVWAYWRESRGGPQRWWRDWSISRIRRGWESWECAD